MRRFYKQITPLHVCITIALLSLIVLIPIISAVWTARNVRASQPGSTGLPRPQSASSFFGPSTGKHANHISPSSVIPGRQYPGVAGHAARRAGRALRSPHLIHANNAFATNVVVSSDNTPAPFGPEPRNGPQAAVNPTNPNAVLVAYNDYTPNGHGGSYVPGYSVSTDGGTSRSQPRTVLGLLKVDGETYDGAA